MGSHYHMNASIGGRSGGRTAVMHSAYIGRTQEYDAELGEHTRDYSYKSECSYHEVFLCKNAPEEYKDPETLWNAVQEKEKAKDAQFYREFECALPNDSSLEERKEMVQKFAQSLADEGMCVEVAMHEDEGNKHFHAQATTRAIKENGEWDVKKTNKYVLDEDGNKVPKLDKKKVKAWEKKNGRKFDYKKESDEELAEVQKRGDRNRREWERKTVTTTDWDTDEKLVEWRARWASIENEFLSEENKVDHRSFADRGIDRVATKHEGYKARQIEADGGVSEIMEYNRQARKVNENIEAFEALKKIRKESGTYDARTGYQEFRETRGRAADLGRTSAAHQGYVADHTGAGAGDREVKVERITLTEGIRRAKEQLQPENNRMSGIAEQLEKIERDRGADKESPGIQWGNDRGDTTREPVNIEDCWNAIRAIRDRHEEISRDIDELKTTQSVPVGRKSGAKELYRGQTGKIDKEQYRINEQQQAQRGQLEEAASRFGQLRATFTELRSRVIQLKEKIQNKVEKAFRKAQEAEKPSEGIKVQPTEQKAVTGQNMTAMERFRQMQEQTDRERAEKRKEESQALQPGKTYRIYADEENGVYINARVQKAGIPNANTVYFSLTVNGQTQELDCRVITDDKSLKDAISYSKPTQDKISEYTETSAQRKFKEAQEKRLEAHPEERPSIREKLAEKKIEADKLNAEHEQEHTVQRRPRMRR